MLTYGHLIGEGLQVAVPADPELPAHFCLADACRNPRAQLSDSRGGESATAAKSPVTDLTELSHYPRAFSTCLLEHGTKVLQLDQERDVSGFP